jgi:hypothetical protein
LRSLLAEGVAVTVQQCFPAAGLEAIRYYHVPLMVSLWTGKEDPEKKVLEFLVT